MGSEQLGSVTLFSAISTVKDLTHIVVLALLLILHYYLKTNLVIGTL